MNTVVAQHAPKM